jgi:hypothetical protein
MGSPFKVIYMPFFKRLFQLSSLLSALNVVNVEDAATQHPRFWPKNGGQPQ